MVKNTEPRKGLYFYPRSPCGERHLLSVVAWKNSGFLSTLSLRRATGLHYLIPYGTVHFYPRSPCGERRDVMGKGLAEKVISIHALLAESDLRIFTITAGG